MSYFATVVQKLPLCRFFAFLVLCCLLATLPETVSSQHLLAEISLEKRIDAAEAIVEGRVVGQEAFWDDDGHMIYTASEVEVYKVFKGAVTSERIRVVTPGGTVGLDHIRVDPSLKLRLGETGIFFGDTPRAAQKNAAVPQFSPYASVQGFIRYGEITGVAADVFRTYADIEADLYPRITQQLGRSFEVRQAYTPPLPLARRPASKSGSMAPSITSFAPTDITGGTGSVLTITGSGFGATRGNSTVGFSDANDGGSTFFEPLDSQYQSWSDTEIQVEVPDRAGTGPIQVTVDGMGSTTSATALTVTYALINVESDGVSAGTFVAYRTHLIDDNGSGGYTFQMFTDFDSDANANAAFVRGLDSWRSTTGFNVLIGTPTTVDIVANDGINVVRFDNGSELPGGVLGRATSRFIGCFINGNTDMDWYVSELDIAFDDGTNWNFSTGAPGGTEYDFESVSFHEVGHTHQFAHVIDTDAAMHFAISNGEQQRSPSAGDLSAGADMISYSTGGACGQSGMTQNVLPVELVAFEAVLEDSDVVLTWETASETNNAGFQVETLADTPGEMASWVEQGWVDGAGTTVETQRYSFEVADFDPGTYRFRLKQIDYDGTFEYSPEVEVFVEVAGSHYLSAVYPNPFNPTTSFSLMVPKRQQVRVEVFDLLGRRVALLNDSALSADERYSFSFDGAALPSGIYLIRAIGEAFATTRQVTLLK